MLDLSLRDSILGDGFEKQCYFLLRKSPRYGLVHAERGERPPNGDRAPPLGRLATAARPVPPLGPSSAHFAPPARNSKARNPLFDFFLQSCAFDALPLSRDLSRDPPRARLAAERVPLTVARSDHIEHPNKDKGAGWEPCCGVRLPGRARDQHAERPSQPPGTTAVACSTADFGSYTLM